ncbi:MAG: 23S rRNA (uracil(1939)-C(5))-methyltransferase RlmD [Lachnospiraceae bacterium]|nr:23S rRNA (uracil(1939)-C(5))-methyltransferase RlmD [Lachnospiraceae bacterium]
MKKNDRIQLKITDMGVNGEGIGKTEGCTFFVKNAVIGDTVSAIVTKLKKGYGYAKMLEVLDPSSDRVDPICPVADQCGGCQIMQLSYPAQLQYKEKKVRENLSRIGGIDLSTCQFDSIIGMDAEVPQGYRNKMQYPLGRSTDGNVISGFYAGRTHYLIGTDHCPVSLPGEDAVRKAVCDFADAQGLSVYEEESGKGLLRHLLIRQGYATGEIMVCLVINGKGLGSEKKEQAFVEALRKTDPHICSICLNSNTEKTNVILGKEIRCLFGEPYITDALSCGFDSKKSLQFRISPQSFYQVNSAQTEKLYQKALEFADLKGNETVWDLYCGIGTISLFLAGHAAKVIGVEIVQPAIENAKENADLNGITNAEFLCGRSEEIFPKAANEKDFRADVVILDPPRKGCDRALLDAIRKVGPEKIVYVSCDSATLARDLKILIGGEDASLHRYQVEKVQPVDMFPNTVHVETVCCLYHQKKDFISVPYEPKDAEYLKQKRE